MNVATIFLLHFDLRFGTFYYEDGGISILSDFIINALGALIGVLGGLWIYYLQKWRQQKDTLKYVVSLIESVIAHSKTQASNCKDLAAELRKRPTDYHMLSFEANHDLKRLADKLNQENFYHSYLGEYKRKPESYSTFKKIYSEIDFLDQIIDQLKSYIEKEFYYIVEMKKKFVDFLEEGEAKSALLTVHPNYINQEQIVVFLNSALMKFRQNMQDPNDVDYPLKEFITPVKNFLAKYHFTKPECNDIVSLLKKAETRHMIVVSKSEALANELENYYHKKLMEHANKLEKITITLKKDFGKTVTALHNLI